VEGASLTLLLAIFFSNPPESLVGDQPMRSEGRSEGIVIGTLLACAVLLARAVSLGRGIAGGRSGDVLPVALGFAGSAVLASLANTLMPEAFEHARPLKAFATLRAFPVVHPGRVSRATTDTCPTAAQRLVWSRSESLDAVAAGSSPTSTLDLAPMGHRRPRSTTSRRSLPSRGSRRRSTRVATDVPHTINTTALSFLHSDPSGRVSGRARRTRSGRRAGARVDTSASQPNR
jgi:hypothetical protein